MPRVLITGAAGFIGRCAVPFFLDSGWEVWGLDHFGAPSAREGRNVLQRLHHDRFHMQVGDLRDPRLPLPEVDVICHLAGRPGIRESWQDPAAWWQSNVNTTERLVQHSLTHNCVLVFASSSAVYGQQSTLPWHEGLRPLPTNPYASSKWVAEQSLLRGAQQGLRGMNLRLFTVYGPGQRPDMAIRRWAESLLLAKPLSVHAPTQMQRDFTFISDVCEGLKLAAEWGLAQAAGNVETVNLAYGQAWRLADAVNLLSQISGRSVPWVLQDPFPGEAMVTWAELSHLQAILQYRPRVNLETGLRNYWHWLEGRAEGPAHVTFT